jgi:tetratricopeptide (TPR) repeat protein
MRYHLLLLLVIMLLSITAKPCGNAYYYADKPLPLKDGFLDYHKILVSYPLHNDSLHRRDEVNNPYFFPVNAADGKLGMGMYRDEQFYKLKDTVLKLLGNPAKSWKLSYKDIANKALAGNIDYKILSDFAWKLAQKNELDIAQKLLLALDAKHPNEYNIMANLGTVYELLGKNKEALLYIAKAVQASPQSHYGSEWLHINILKRKLNIDNNYSYSNFFEMNNQLKVTYSNSLYKEKFKPEELGKYHRDTLMVHLAYQLHERMFFIQKDDELMAEMLYMFMQCMIHRGDDAYAAEIAQLVTQYGDRAAERNVFRALGYCLKRNRSSI